MRTRLIFHTLAAMAFLGAAALQPAGAASIVTEWLDVAIPAAEDAAPEPTSSARFFAVLHSAMYEAWAAYDETAVGLVTGKLLKGTGGAPTVANKREAISYAAYAALLDLAPAHRRRIDVFMNELGYAPTGTSRAAQLGRRAAAAILDMRRTDGSNQSDLYRDTSRFETGDPADHDKWQPAATELMNTKALNPVTPHWSIVIPFALARADEFRPPAPPAFGTPAFDAQIAEILKTSAGLSDEQKAAAEYWANFISSPAPQLIRLTKFVSLRDDYRIDTDVKLFFAVSNALLDAGISCWETKYHYNYIRPYTAIRSLGDKKIVAWDNPNLSAASNHLPNTGHAIDWGHQRQAREMLARQWLPYLPTPPFPSYVSGHSQFTATWARVMELMTGSTTFGFRAEWPKLYVENRWLDKPVMFDYPTFASAAEASGVSRIYGGIHWPVDNSEGLAAGGRLGEKVWRVTQGYLSGEARPVWMAASSLAPPVWQKMALAPGVTLTNDGGLRIAFDSLQGGSDQGDSAKDNSFSGEMPAGWQTTALDAPPAGRYRVSAIVQVQSDASSGLSVGLRAVDPRRSGQLLAASEKKVALSDGQATPTSVPVELEFDADGTTPLRLSFQARAIRAGSAAVLRAIKLVKVDPFAHRTFEPQRASN